jgi:hypothetical protein
VGRPGTPTNEWVTLDCSIWRYHPVTKKFETVCRGTTNPWGLDWDENGQAFFSNNVIGHFWHVIPGAFYKRMFGSHDNPHLYELMDSCSDHLHWQGAKWSEARGGPAHDALGGGHSHCGLMIYQGDNFPPEWRGRAFMGNIHGNRVLYDVPSRNGSGYTAKHGGNFLLADDPWFRSTVQITGPDGGVFIADWNDYGECHDSDGSYRSSGRIYRVTYGTPRPLEMLKLNVAKLSDSELVNQLDHKSEWYRRHAQRVLQERAVAGKLEKSTVASLRKLHAAEKDVPDDTVKSCERARTLVGHPPVDRGPESFPRTAGQVRRHGARGQVRLRPPRPVVRAATPAGERPLGACHRLARPRRGCRRQRSPAADVVWHRARRRRRPREGRAPTRQVPATAGAPVHHPPPDGEVRGDACVGFGYSISSP